MQSSKNSSYEHTKYMNNNKCITCGHEFNGTVSTDKYCNRCAEFRKSLGVYSNFIGMKDKPSSELENIKHQIGILMVLLSL